MGKPLYSNVRQVVRVVSEKSGLPSLPGVTELTCEDFAERTKLENITLGSVITKVNVNLFAGESLSSDITLTLHPDQANAEGTLKQHPVQTLRGQDLLGKK